MSARWVFMILACCRLSHADQPHQGSRACYDALKTVCVSAGENVSVPCPKIKERAELVTFNLFQNMEQVYNHTCSPGACTVTKMGLHENTENTSVSFVLSGVNASDHALYRCEMKHAFPPPLITEAGDLILVLVKGHQCNRTPEVTVTAAEQYCGFYWILILALVSLYSIIATVLAIFNCVKLRRTDSQSDYMNTKPLPARDRRKKRIQNPFPRHF
ncbi:T-cell-specific surface glycoprotein CD28-like isoform X1 [Sparus aurata]|uniref:T-cell-specific surface glycoprotein CD28-like isoform X1 n=1 Tax=Sparus aurata TaxID=8175 RepID=UPI0011C0E8DA|nr:T-cell-specific surface glycoprotein CD28-like isoform X1 [Sparus aurata]